MSSAPDPVTAAEAWALAAELHAQVCHIFAGHRSTAGVY